MRRLAQLGITIIAIALTLPATATAKGPIESLEVCGAGECASVTDTSVLGGPMAADALFAGGSPAGDPPPGAYYTVEARMHWGDTFSLFLLPSGIITTPDGGWATAQQPLAAALDDATAGLQPLRPRISRVEIDGARVDDPATYLPLLGRMESAALSAAQLAAQANEDYRSLVKIEVTTSQATPWTPVGTIQATYDPSLGVVMAGGGWMHAPDELGAGIESDAGITPGRDLTPWAVLGGIALAAAAAAALVMLARRKRARPASVA